MDKQKEMEAQDPIEDVEEPEKDLDESEESEESLEEEKDESYDSLMNSYMRLQADFENYRNRTEREKSNIINLANEGLILDLLPIIDDLDRVILHGDEEDEFIQGVSMVRDSFLKILESEGLEMVNADGEIFDPNLHHAVLTEDSNEPENTVIETLQIGYKLNDKVIRPAMVKVSK